ncbi:hypothetical protein [Bdellovibrio sp. HCB209]|uniref:hypothetical protein n=1 Tax=Bdellovibrio sp. HCB209 TaxID=3394354 RepID=UPI0039B41CEA
MRLVIFISLSFATAISSAAERFNHITCEYQKSGSSWEFMAVNYNRDGFTLEPGQSAAIVTAWTTTRSKNVGYCLSFKGTADSAIIETNLNVFTGSEIFGTDLQNCAANGANVTTIKKQTFVTQHGDSVEMSVENWWDEGEPTLLLKHYVLKLNENDYASEIAVAKCNEMKP